MIGNDIVDLNLAQLSSNWQRHRFIEKLFTSKEQVYIKNAVRPFEMIWHLWSMKEAAYKLYTQQNSKRFYAPRQFECDIMASNFLVTYKHFKCYVSSVITSNYILSEARLKAEQMTSEVLLLKEGSLKTQSHVIKSKLTFRISEALKIPKIDLIFKKNEFGIPTVEYKSKTINVSLTHHGTYGAYAFNLI